MRAFPLCLLASLVALAGDEKRPSAAKPESLAPEKFSEVHAPLFREAPSKEVSRLTETIAGTAAASSPVARRNFIDEHIFSKMERDNVPHAPLATDYEFLRRVSLDLTGRIPSSAEIREFVADTDPNKRDKLIDRLIGSEAFVEKWAYFFMDLFRANGKMGRGQELFHYWMKENLRSDRPYDDAVRDIIAASAKSNHVVAASNLIAREHVQGKPQPDDGDDWGMVQQLDTHDELNVLYSQRFLGLNLSCISCHDGQGHLEKVNTWLSKKRRSDFYRTSAFLGRNRYLMYWEDGKPQSGEFLIDDAAPGYDTKGPSMIRVPRFGGPGDPTFILTGEKPQPGEEPREAFGRMLTAHPQFARATANMFWAKLMGFGIVEPYDEFDLDRPDQASHPELLDALGRDFSENGYSIQHLFRTITRSSAYQLSSRFPGEWKETYTKYYARKFVRQLNAEEVHDSLAIATSRPGAFKARDQQRSWAMQMSGPVGGADLKNFMATFGQSNRSNPPKDPVATPLQAMLLMQSPVVTERVMAAKDSRVQRLLDTYKDDERIVEEMFLSTLGRPATPGEREVALDALREDRVRGAQNLQWALINQVEFVFNY
jgi:hypothetical protein